MLNNSLLNQTTTIVFIDSAVSDYQTLQTGVVEGVETIILSANRDGIEEITEFLQQHPQINSIHIVSHGSPGCLYLGNTQLNLDNISKYADSLQHWQSQSILLYGCNVAAGDAGEEFISKLHEITNATISASVTKTGNAALGGNWDLEVNIPKQTEKYLVFRAETLVSYQGVCGYAYAVTVVGNYAYTAGSDSMEIIDISNPTNPLVKGSYNLNGGLSNEGGGITVVGNYAYLADGSSGLQIIDISNRTNPILKGNYNTSDYALDVQVVDNYAYVTDDTKGLQIIDISNPTNPILKGNYNPNSYAYGVQVVGNYAYVADHTLGLQIIDISNPTNPILKKNYNYNPSGVAYAVDVQVVGNYAYVVDDTTGLQIIDISNPTNPILKGNYNPSGDAYHVKIVGNYAYVADGYSGLQIIDISNPTTPTLKGNYDTTGNAMDVQVVGNYAYVADDDGGLKIIDVTEFTNSSTNQAPTNLTLSNSSIAENQPISTVVGNFTTTDPDTGNTFTYSLVSGTGSTNNSLFTISGTQIKTKASFNFESKNSYSIRVRTTDQGGLFYDKQLTITINNIAENPITGTTANNTLNGTANPDRIDGLDGNDKLYGLAGNDDLYGGNGNDTLDGGTGADALIGGAGNDTYYVDNIADTITEAANAGTDAVFSTITYTLGNNLENLTLQGTTAINGTGNTLNNIITGNAAANTLDGKTGADTLIGGLGNDSYYVDNVGDIITEAANAGTDSVFSTVTYTLANNVENLTLQGTTAINGTGNTLNNVLTGNAAANILSGGVGVDTLTGNAGADTLIGGLGNDILYLGLNDGAVDIVKYASGDGADTIYQFVRGVGGDKIQFTGIANIDVVTSGANTLLRIGDGTIGNSGFGTGQLLATLSGTSGFIGADANVNLFGANFLFS